MIKREATETVLKAFIESKENKTKRSTISIYQSKINKYFIPYFPRIAKHITLKRLSYFLEYIDAQDLEDSTQHEVLRLANDFFKFAYESNYTKHLIKLSIPKIRDKKIEIFTRVERNKIKDYLIKHLNFFNFGILLAAYTGIRLGELAALQFKDIDEQGILKITKSLQRVKDTKNISKNRTIVIIDTPKSETSIRDIPIPTFILPLIGRLAQRSENYILTGTDMFMDMRTIQRRFKIILILCGISIRKFHTLRHTFATYALEDDLSLEAVRKLLGHTTDKQTLKYVHTSIEYLKKNVEKIKES